MEYTNFTSTYQEPTKEELELQIVDHAIQYSYKKWYEFDSKKYHLSRIKYYSLKLSKEYFSSPAI